MKRALTLFILLPLFAAARAALASGPAADDSYGYLLNLPLEDLAQVPIKSSGLFDMTRDQTPGVTYVVTADQLDRFGIRSLGEYLSRMQPSFATVIHGTQGITTGVRGLMVDNSAKTLLLRDNLNMNNRYFVGINGSELSSPLLGDIDRVEVATGPGALQHGSGAINGFLNLVSATGASKPGMRMNASYGSGDSRVVEGSYGQVFSDRANLFLYAGYDKSNGVKPYYPLPADQWDHLATPAGGYDGIRGTPSSTFLDNVRVGLTDNDYKFSLRSQLGRDNDPLQLDFKALLSHTSNVDPVLGEYLSPAASWVQEIANTANARGGRYSPFYIEEADNFLVSPEIKLRLNPENEVKIIPFYQTIKTSNQFSDFLTDQVSQLGINLLPKPDPALNTATHTDCPAMNCGDNYTYGDEEHLGLTLIHTYTGIKDQTIAWGAEAKYFEFKTNPWYWTTASLYAEDQLRFGKLTVLPGLRYDRTYFAHSIATVPPFNDGPYPAPDDVGSFTKQLALAYQVNNQQTAKLSYQEGFRFADAWFQQWAAHVNQTSQAITPEKSYQYEADYTFNGLLDKRLNILTSLFYNLYQHTQGWIVDDYTFGNSPNDITSVGWDLVFDYHPTKTWDLGLSYSYARPLDSYENNIRVANDDDTWTRYPVHMIKFHAGHELFKDFYLGGVGVLESARYDKANTVDPRVIELFDNWSMVMDANAWYQVNQRLKISLSAKELVRINYDQYPAYYSGTRPLDSPRPDSPLYYLTISWEF
ncbi:MAG: TonB-dependent receptor plug domain-containing protein [Desulfobacteraceae bacterium]|nr:TonB-dependent receptor plug domain-containing protein [Desulfobacteraceae bacterium]